MAYKYKEMIQKKIIKKNKNLKKPGALWSLYLKSKRGIKVPEGMNKITYWSKEYKNISENEKKRLEEKLQKEKEEYEKHMDIIKKRIYAFPPKPNNSFAVYLKTNFEEIKKNKNYEQNCSILENGAKIWQNLSREEKGIYEKISQEEIKIFNKRLKQFNKFGYYLKNNAINEEKNEEDEHVKKKKKRRNTKIESRKKRAKSINKSEKKKNENI